MQLKFPTITFCSFFVKRKKKENEEEKKSMKQIVGEQLENFFFRQLNFFRPGDENVTVK